MILDTINYLLAIEIKVIPVAILYLICLFPTEFRKQMRMKYTPVYCSLPILQHSRRLRDFHIGGFENTKEERKRIIKDNRISFIIEAMVCPAIFGVLFGICKAPIDVITPLIILLIGTRVYQFGKCTWEIKKEKSLPNNFEIVKLGFLYIVFLWLYAENMKTGYSIGLEGIESIIYNLGTVIKLLVKAYLFSFIGAPLDVTSINFNYPSYEEDPSLEFTVDEE